MSMFRQKGYTETTSEAGDGFRPAVTDDGPCCIFIVNFSVAHLFWHAVDHIQFAERMENPSFLELRLQRVDAIENQQSIQTVHIHEFATDIVNLRSIEVAAVEVWIVIGRGQIGQCIGESRAVAESGNLSAAKDISIDFV